MYFMQSDGYDRSRSNTYKFLGLDRGHYTYKGEFEDMLNMATVEYPCAAPRVPRVPVCNFPDTVQAVAAPDVSNVSELTHFTGIAGGKFYYNGVVKSGSVNLNSSYNWSIARLVTAYVLNGYDADTNTSVMYAYDIFRDTFTRGGTTMDDLIVTAGVNRNGSYLCSYRYAYTDVYNYNVTDSSDDVLFRNADYFNKYFHYSNTAPAANFFEQYFNVGDDVSISGFPGSGERPGQVWSFNASSEELLPQTTGSYDEFNTLDLDSVPDPSTVSIYQVCSAKVKGFEISSYSIRGVRTYIHYIYFDLKNKNNEPVDFSNMEGAAGTFYCSGIVLSSLSHTFDNISVHHGRLWGTLPTGTMIYGSSSSDMFDYSSVDDYGAPVYARLASSYPGKYTGIAEFGLDLLAFKDDHIEIISGDNHSNYASSVIHGIGCIDNNSIAITPGGVIFLSYNGFYLYNGSQFPTRISNKLYDSRYVSAVSGFDGFKYYASATRADGETELLVYDMRYSLWTIEDSTVHNNILGGNAVNALGMFRFKGDLYIADNTSGAILRYDPHAAEVFRWSATSVKTHNNTLDNKALTEMWIRAECIDGGSFSVSISVDGGEFKVLSAHSSSSITVYRIPVRIENGSSFRYKIFGKGKVIIYEIELHTPSGGRQYKDYARDTSGDSEHDIIPEKKNEGKNYLI